MKYLIFIIAFIFVKDILGFNCKTISEQQEFTKCEYIVIGEIISEDEDTFTIRVDEWLKEPITGILVFIKGSTSILPEMGSSWLVYCHAVQDDKFRASECGWSSELTNPSLAYHLESMVIPPPEVIEDIKSVYISNEVSKLRPLINLNNHISNLRIKKQIKMTEEVMFYGEKRFMKLSTRDWIFAIFLFSMLCVILVQQNSIKNIINNS